MPKLTGFSQTKDEIKKGIDAAKVEVIDYIERTVVRNLNSNHDADGNMQPKKKESTKKSYKKSGYDTENWLKRSGDSTELVSKKNKSGVTVAPIGQEILSYHKKEADNLFSLAKKDVAAIQKIIVKNIEKELK